MSHVASFVSKIDKYPSIFSHQMKAIVYVLIKHDSFGKE